MRARTTQMALARHGDVTPDQAATQLIARIDALTPKQSGTFQHANGTSLPW